MSGKQKWNVQRRKKIAVAGSAPTSVLPRKRGRKYLDA